MRTVSFFGPEEGGIGGGGTEADDGREAVGGLGGGKKFGEEIFRALTASEREQADCRFHEPAIGSGRSRAVSHLAPSASLQADAATGCEPSLFLVGQARPFSVEEIDQKSPTCHYAILPPKFLTIQFPVLRPNPIECPRRSRGRLSLAREMGEGASEVSSKTWTGLSSFCLVVDVEFVFEFQW